MGKAKNKHVGKTSNFSETGSIKKKKKKPREGDAWMEGDGGSVGFNDTISLRWFATASAAPAHIKQNHDES